MPPTRAVGCRGRVRRPRRVRRRHDDAQRVPGVGGADAVDAARGAVDALAGRAVLVAALPLVGVALDAAASRCRSAPAAPRRPSRCRRSSATRCSSGLSATRRQPRAERSRRPIRRRSSPSPRREAGGRRRPRRPCRSSRWLRRSSCSSRRRRRTAATGRRSWWASCPSCRSERLPSCPRAPDPRSSAASWTAGRRQSWPEPPSQRSRPPPGPTRGGSSLSGGRAGAAVP